MSQVLVPEGQHPPLARITPTDHGAYIIITTAISFSITLLFLGVRVFVRSLMSPGWSIEDLLVGGATLLALLHFTLMSVACGKGLGKAAQLLGPDALDSIQRLVYGSNLLFVVAVGLSRLATTCFSLRLTPIIQQKLFLKGLLGYVVAWTVAATFAIALTCDLAQPWVLIGQQCSGYLLRWEVLEILGCVYEIGMFASAIWLTWKLQVHLEKKIAVILSFSCRLLMIVFAGLRLHSFSQKGLTTDPTLLEAEFLCWTSAELNYSVISATMPILRPLISNLATHYGGGFGQSDGSTYAGWSSGSYTRSANRHRGNRSIHLQSLSKRDDGEHQITIQGPRGGGKHGKAFGRGYTGQKRTSAVGGSSNEDAASVESSDSKRMIIRKDVTWVVDHNRNGM